MGVVSQTSRSSFHEPLSTVTTAASSSFSADKDSRKDSSKDPSKDTRRDALKDPRRDQRKDARKDSSRKEKESTVRKVSGKLRFSSSSSSTPSSSQRASIPPQAKKSSKVSLNNFISSSTLSQQPRQYRQPPVENFPPSVSGAPSSAAPAPGPPPRSGSVSGPASGPGSSATSGPPVPGFRRQNLNGSATSLSTNTSSQSPTKSSRTTGLFKRAVAAIDRTQNALAIKTEQKIRPRQSFSRISRGGESLPTASPNSTAPPFGLQRTPSNVSTSTTTASIIGPSDLRYNNPIYVNGSSGSKEIPTRSAHPGFVGPQPRQFAEQDSAEPEESVEPDEEEPDELDEPDESADEPAGLVKPAESVRSIEPNGTVKPTEPTEPVDLADTSGPVKPIHSVDTVQSTAGLRDSFHSVHSSKRASLAASVGSSGRAKPVSPSAQVDPVSTVPVSPIVPVDLRKSAEATRPTKSAVPDADSEEEESEDSDGENDSDDSDDSEDADEEDDEAVQSARKLRPADKPVDLARSTESVKPVELVKPAGLDKTTKQDEPESDTSDEESESEEEDEPNEAEDEDDEEEEDEPDARRIDPVAITGAKAGTQPVKPIGHIRSIEPVEPGHPAYPILQAQRAEGSRPIQAQQNLQQPQNLPPTRQSILPGRPVQPVQQVQPVPPGRSTQAYRVPQNPQAGPVANPRYQPIQPIIQPPHPSQSSRSVQPVQATPPISYPPQQVPQAYSKPYAQANPNLPPPIRIPRVDNKMHQTSSRLLRMTDDDRPFTKDFKDLFSTLIVSLLPLTPHRVRLTKVENTFLSEDAINNLGSLKFSQSNRMPDPKDPSRIVTTTTTTTFSMAKDMARSICQRFLEARFIESADGKLQQVYTMKGSVWQLTPKGISILDRFCARNGIQQKQVAELIGNNTTQLVILERDNQTDKILNDRGTIEVIFRRFIGVNGLNVKSSPSSADSDSLNDYRDGLTGVKMASERKVMGKSFKDSFTGKAATDWLMDVCTTVDRRETNEIAGLFVEHGLMEAIQMDRAYQASQLPGANVFQPTKAALYQMTAKGRDLVNGASSRGRSSESDGGQGPRHGIARDSNTQRLDKILNDAALRLLFRENLRDTHCEENLSFYLDVDDFVRNCRQAIRQVQKNPGTTSMDGIKEIMAQAYGIYNAFLAPGSPCELNIDHQLRNNLATRMTKAVGQDGAMIETLHEVMSLFEDAQNAVFKLMASDSVPKFLRHPKYEYTLRNYDFDAISVGSSRVPERSQSRSNRT